MGGDVVTISWSTINYTPAAGDNIQLSIAPASTTFSTLFPIKYKSVTTASGSVT